MKLKLLAFSEFWHAHNAREKNLLIMLGVLLGSALLYGVLWAPAAAHRARLSAEIPVLQSALAQMKRQEQEARRLARAAVGTALSGEALTAALKASLAASGLDAAKISTVRAGARIQLSAAPFSSWAAWLERARKQYKVRVAESQIKALTQAGQVEVDTLLRAPQ